MLDHGYKLLELTGSSTISIEDAVQKAIAKASQTVRHIHWFTVTETRGSVMDGKVAHWQIPLKIGFTLESDFVTAPDSVSQPHAIGAALFIVTRVSRVH